MKVLVTGAAGFIGSHLVERLLEDYNNEVWCVDNLSNGKFSNIRKNIDKVTFCGGDILGALPKESFKVVYHLAALHSVPKSFTQPEKYLETNILGTWNVLSKYSGTARIVNISSSSSDQCKSPYAISKKTTELCANLFKNTVSLRLFNVFGERQLPEDGAVIPQFCKSMILNNPAAIYGDGEQRRDFSYVKDVVREIENYGQGNKKKLKGVYDVGYGQSTSVNELFEMIAKRTGCKKNPLKLEERKGDVKNSLAKNKMEKSLYGFDIGLERTVNWFKEKYKC